jgi:hypothetical protein
VDIGQLGWIGVEVVGLPLAGSVLYVVVSGRPQRRVVGYGTHVAELLRRMPVLHEADRLDLRSGASEHPSTKRGGLAPAQEAKVGARSLLSAIRAAGDERRMNLRRSERSDVDAGC